MAIETRTINGSLTEIYVGGGNFITQSFPTNFHQFYKRKILTANEKIGDYKEVSTSQKTQLEEADAKWIEPSNEFIYDCESIGAVYNSLTGFFELNGLTDLSTEDMRKIYSQRAIFDSAFYYPYGRQSVFSEQEIRTIPLQINRRGGQTSLNKCFEGAYIECIVFNTPKERNMWPYQYGAYSVEQAFLRCGKLKTIKGLAVDWTTKFRDTFRVCSSLTNIELTNLNNDVSFEFCPMLTLESIKYMIEWRFEVGKFYTQNGTMNEITITLHPNAYARLTDEIFALAAEKQITLATTN